MKKLFELLSKVSEARDAAMQHRAEPKPDDKDWRAKDQALTDTVRTAEREYREAEIAARDAPADKGAEKLRRRIECRQYLAAAVEGRGVDGAEREYNQELKLPDHVMPWEALEPREREVRAEHRTDDPTTITDDVAGQPQMETLRRVFQTGNVGFLGVRTPMVAYGEPNFPIMADVTASNAAQPGAAGAGAFAAGGEVEADALTFTRETVEPHRLSARYKMRMEDQARFPQLEDMLRSDLRMVMTELRDRQVLAGGFGYTGRSATGTDVTVNKGANDIEGIIAGMIVARPTGAQAASGIVPADTAAKLDCDKLIEFLIGIVDGRYANTMADGRWLFGVGTYKLLATLQCPDTDSDYTALDYMARRGVMHRTSAFLPAENNLGAATSDNAERILGTSRGGDAVAPVWQGVTMIRDPYTGASKAELAITAHALHGFKLLRTKAWRMHGAKLA